MNDDLVIWMPKRIAESIRAEGPRAVIEFALKQFYERDPDTARNFETQMELLNVEQMAGDAMMLNGVIPDFVYWAIRVIDPEFWKSRSGYDLFFQVYSKAKIQREKLRVTVA